MADGPNMILSPEILGRGLAESDFLSHIFHPKTVRRPTGIRKRKVVGRGGGRKASRIRSYNRMDAVKQRIIDVAGRDKYLRGEVTLGEAKRSLRPRAIDVGVAKPIRIRTPKDVSVERAAEHIYRIAHERNPIRETGPRAGDPKPPINRQSISRNIRDYMTPEMRAATPKLSYDELKRRANMWTYDRYDVVDGSLHNPYWYH